MLRFEWRELAQTLPGARGYRVDVTDYAAVVKATGDVVRDFGRIDILVNSAGINGPIAPLLDYPLDRWRSAIAVNLDGVFFCCRAVVKEMLKSGNGRVVNMSSIGDRKRPFAAALRSGGEPFTSQVWREGWTAP